MVGLCLFFFFSRGEGKERDTDGLFWGGVGQDGLFKKTVGVGGTEGTGDGQGS
jgi:hypothetical protein